MFSSPVVQLVAILLAFVIWTKSEKDSIESQSIASLFRIFETQLVFN